MAAKKCYAYGPSNTALLDYGNMDPGGANEGDQVIEYVAKRHGIMRGGIVEWVTREQVEDAQRALGFGE